MFATHQPIFLPWPGLFAKLLLAGTLVLLDDVQFPRGRSWMARNRMKSDTAELWLKVPVLRKGKGLQTIRDVEICDETDWRAKHLRSLREKYARAPYLSDYFPALEEIYQRRQTRLAGLNMDLIRFLQDALHVEGQVILQSTLGITGAGTELLTSLAASLNADEYLTFAPVEKYLDTAEFARKGVRLRLIRFSAPVYPQLWGANIANLSALDLLLNCGPRSLDILRQSASLPAA